MCWSPEHEEIRNYRVDRMDIVRAEEDTVSEEAIIRSSEVADYTEQAFKMYTGEECAAILQFEDSLDSRHAYKLYTADLVGKELHDTITRTDT